MKAFETEQTAAACDTKIADLSQVKNRARTEREQRERGRGREA
jgi:hypothetical protein